MTADQSKRLKVGHRVSWHDSATDRGTVTATDWSGVQIEWDNGKTQFFHHNNMTEVSKAPCSS
jgi:hypothetical protein